MEEATEVCAGTIVTTNTQATYTIATSSSGTNLVTSQNNQPISLVGEHHFLPPRQGTPAVAGGPQITIGPPVRNFLLYDKNAGNQVVEVAPIELSSLQAEAPSRWQEAYNIYVLNDNTNQRAREAFDKGWITFQSTQRIYMNALHQTRVLCRQGQLSHTYLRHMLSYGKFYGYISPYNYMLIRRMTYGEFDLISLIKMLQMVLTVYSL